MRNPGTLLELSDGRRGIAYHAEQIHKDKITIKLIDHRFTPIMSEITGKQKVVFKTADEVKLIGYVD